MKPKLNVGNVFIQHQYKVDVLVFLFFFSEVTGKFFKDRKEAKSSTESMDETLRQKVWDMSVLYCHLQDKILPPPALAIPKKTRVRISVTPSPEEEETEIDQPKLYNPGKLKA